MSIYTISNFIYSGLDTLLSMVAVVEIVLLIVRMLFRMQDTFTVDRIELINKVILFASFLSIFLFFIPLFSLWYSDTFEQFAFYNRVFGKYWYVYALMFSGKLLFPQLYWFKSLRRNLYATWMVAILIILPIGLLLERWIIIITSWDS